MSRPGRAPDSSLESLLATVHIDTPSLVSFHTPARLLYDVAYGDTSQGKLEKEFRERRKSASRLLNQAGFYSTNPTSQKEMSGKRVIRGQGLAGFPDRIH